MSQQSKLILQKINLQLKIIVILLSVSIVGIFIISYNYSCGIQHVVLINDISNYETTLDPEFCESLLDKIDIFNEECEPKIEILDCE